MAGLAAQGMVVSDERAQELINEADKDGDGMVDAAEIGDSTLGRLHQAVKSGDTQQVMMLLYANPIDLTAQNRCANMPVAAWRHAGAHALNTFLAGLGRDGDTWVYVSQGAFGWGPRTRAGSRNSIDLLVLRGGAGGSEVGDGGALAGAVAAYVFIALVTLAALAGGVAVLSRGRTVAARA